MRALVVASVYLTIDTAPPTKKLEQLVSHCESKGLSLVITCDSNSHYTARGSSEYNARGIRLLEYLATTGLEIANIRFEPTFVAGNKRTIIDITLASELIGAICGRRLSFEVFRCFSVFRRLCQFSVPAFCMTLRMTVGAVLRHILIIVSCRILVVFRSTRFNRCGLVGQY